MEELNGVGIVLEVKDITFQCRNSCYLVILFGDNQSLYPDTYVITGLLGLVFKVMMPTQQSNHYHCGALLTF